jgi:hypothetical protein
MTTIYIKESGNWVVPEDVYRIDVTLYGGGAGGSGALMNTDSFYTWGYAGSGGAASVGITTKAIAVVPGDILAVVIGDGGVGGNAITGSTANLTSGGSGGNTTFTGAFTGRGAIGAYGLVGSGGNAGTHGTNGTPGATLDGLSPGSTSGQNNQYGGFNAGGYGAGGGGGGYAPSTPYPGGAGGKGIAVVTYVQGFYEYVRNSGDWIVPVGVHNVTTTLYGGGAGGMGSFYCASTSSSSRQGVGGYASSGVTTTNIAVTPGSVLPVVIGDGGIGGNAIASCNTAAFAYMTAGGSGGDTTFPGASPGLGAIGRYSLDVYHEGMTGAPGATLDGLSPGSYDGDGHIPVNPPYDSNHEGGDGNDGYGAGGGGGAIYNAAFAGGAGARGVAVIMYTVLPATMVLGAFDVQPKTVQIGTDFTVTQVVDNIGGESGVATVTFTVDGGESQVKTATIEAGGTATLSATYTMASEGSADVCADASCITITGTTLPPQCPVTCPTGQHCDGAATNYECVDDVLQCPIPCPTGQHCDGATTNYVCVDDVLQCPIPCPTGQHCDGATTNYECVADALQCPPMCSQGFHCDETTNYICIKDESSSNMMLYVVGAAGVVAGAYLLLGGGK